MPARVIFKHPIVLNCEPPRHPTLSGVRVSVPAWIKYKPHWAETKTQTRLQKKDEDKSAA